MDIINATRRDPPVFKCFNVTYSSSAVCSGAGVCMFKDNCICQSGYYGKMCDSIEIPIQSGPVKVFPIEGMALSQNFTLQSEPWKSNLSLQYAFGMNISSGPFQLTQFSRTPTAFTILPYISSFITIFMFVKDPRGNIYVSDFNSKVQIFKYNGSSLDFTFYNEYFKKIIMLDQSSNMSSILISEIDFTVNGSMKALTSLQLLTSNIGKDSSMINTVSTKLADFLKMANSSGISENETLAVISVISNIYQSNSSIDSLVTGLTSALVTSGFSSAAFNITVATVSVGASGQYVSHGDVSTDFSEIFSGISSAGQKLAISVVSYTADSSQTSMVSNQIDLNFYTGGSARSVSGLQNPIKLNFKTDSSLLSKAKPKQKPMCKYFDVMKKFWKGDGCSTSMQSNFAISCACNHATKFSIMLDDTSSSPKRISYSSFALISFFSILIFKR